MIKLVEELNDLNQCLEKLNFANKQEKLNNLIAQSEAKDFWDNSEKAQAHMKEQSKLQAEIGPWLDLKNSFDELNELLKLNDVSLEKDLETQKSVLSAELYELKKQLKFSGKFDNFDALVSIHAGAGGTDAQDWAEMLMRMYTRWAESNKLKCHILNQSSGEEAGIKSVDLEFAGPFAYGKLKAEHGVHRLVRLSPFNADAKRQTSFAKVEVMPKIDTPDELPLDENDLKIDVFRAGGHGGQSVNTTDSAVRITHIPTNIVVTIQNERSQLQNKETALTILRSKLAQLQMDQHLENLKDIKGPNEQAAWGNQIRSYVLHPYNMVKDLRTGYETSQTEKVLSGDINDFIDAYLDKN